MIDPKKVFVYTAIFNSAVTERFFENLNPHVNYILFSNKIINTNWDLRVVKQSQDTWRREARYYKTLSHVIFPEADYTIWLDAQFHLAKDPVTILEEYLATNEISTFRHRHRQCLYQEAKICISKKYDKQIIIESQIKDYKQEGYPEKNGLCETGVMLRKHTSAIKELNELWWHEVKNKSVRDQISFNYSLYKKNLFYYPIPAQSFKKSRDFVFEQGLKFKR